MTGAMYAAIGGLKTHMSNLNVIGNNIANVNTVGYKAQRMTFQESIYTMSKAGSNGTLTVGGNNPSQIGYGAGVGSIDLNMSPSTYSPTGYDLDCMLMGEGFFLVGSKDITVGSASDLTKFQLTRVGDFWKDPEGFIADRGGQVAYGFQTVQNPFKNERTGGDVTVSTSVRWMGYTGKAATDVMDPNSETIVSASLGPMHLPMGAAAPTYENGGLDPVSGEENWQEGDPVFDLLGPVVKDPTTGALSRSAVSLSDIVAEAVAGVDTSITDEDDLPDNVEYATWSSGEGDDASTREVWAYTGPADAAEGDRTWRVIMDKNNNILKIEFRNGTGRADGGVQVDDNGGYTVAADVGYCDWPALDDFNYNGEYTGDDDLFGENFPAYFMYDGPIPNKDGAPVEAESMGVNAQGGIYGITDTGLTFVAGYLAVGSCASNDGVTHLGGPYYQCQDGAGDMRVAALGALLKGRYIGDILNVAFDENGVPVAYQPSALDRVLSGGTNEVKNGGLEASGTDVATEFSNMIITQRGYQANTRIVTVTDSMLEELVNMKR